MEIFKTTMTVRGQDIEVKAEVRNGGQEASWSLDIGGRILTDETLSGLYRKAMDESRKAGVKLDIRFTKAAGDHIERGTVYAIHGGTGNPMVRWESGTTSQLDRISSDILAPLTDEEMAEVRRLQAAAVQAQKALQTFKASHALELRRLLSEALAAPRES